MCLKFNNQSVVCRNLSAKMILQPTRELIVKNPSGISKEEDQAEDQKCPQWISKLSERDYGSQTQELRFESCSELKYTLLHTRVRSSTYIYSSQIQVYLLSTDLVYLLLNRSGIFSPLRYTVISSPQIWYISS